MRLNSPWRSFIPAALVVLTSTADRQVYAQACRLEVLATGTVQAVRDGSTLVLEDGRQVRLDGIQIPRPRQAEARIEPEAPEAQASTTLVRLVGRDVVLKGSSAGTDRYGRLRALVFIRGQDPEESVQHALVARGLASVASRETFRGCAADLLARERQARNSRLGIWSAPDYAIVRADDPAAVLGLRGRLALVEGRVLSVRESGSTIYVNFGRRWSEDFTVTIAKRNERIFTAAGLEPKRLERRQIRVRGWVEERGGPWIEATRPEQIELLGQN